MNTPTLVQARIKPEWHRRLKVHTARLGTSIQDVVSALVIQYVEACDARQEARRRAEEALREYQA